VQFRVLGPVEALRDGGPVALGGPKQRQLLLVLLSRPNRFIATDWLVDALWDGQPPASGHVTLRTYVAGLRRALEPDRAARATSGLLRSHRDGYELAVPPENIDATRFAALADQAATALAAGEAVAAERLYAGALELWRGEPMPEAGGLIVLEPELTRLHDLFFTVRLGGFAAAVAAGRAASVLPDLRHFVAANPLSEPARLQLMLALYRSGQQAEALSIFDTGRRLLAEELGADPSPELAELHHLILNQSVPPPTPTPSPAVTAVPTTTGAQPSPPAETLVGRESELSTLGNLLAKAAGQGGRVTLIVGEPGIGKTTLARALGQRATEAGIPVVWGRCPNVGQAPPFWLWTQLVRTLAALPQAGPTRATAALPAFARPAPSAAPPAPSEAAELDPSERFHMYEAVGELIRAVAGAAGLVMVLDDLHAADADSLLLLRFLSAGLAGSRALVVGTLRPYEQEADLVAAVAELARGNGFTQLQLAGLDSGAVAALIERQTGEAPVAGAVDRLVARTGGNPFFLNGLLAHTSDPAGGELPPGILDTVRWRLSTLESATRDCLDLLAVAGHDLGLSSLAAARQHPTETCPSSRAAARQDPAETGLSSRAAAHRDSAEPGLPNGSETLRAAEDLAGAFGAGLVVEAGPGVVGFRHPLFAESVYAGLAPAWRAVLHGRLAKVYERDAAVAPAEVAYHYGQALGLGHGEEYLRWSLLAAEDATRRSAYADAIAHLERAAGQVRGRSAQDPAAARTELTVRLHLASLWQMTAGIGNDEVDRVCDRIRVLMTLVAPETDIGPALWVLSELAANQARYEHCAELAGQLMSLPGDGTGVLAAAGEYLLGVVGYFTGNLAEADERLSRAISQLRGVDLRLLGRQIGRRPILAAHNFRALVRSLLGDSAAARADLAAAQALAERMDDRYGRANVHLYTAWVAALQEGDLVAGRQAAQRCYETGVAEGLPHFVATGRFFLSWAEVLGGDLTAIPAMKETGAGIYLPGLRSTRTITYAAMAAACLAAGALDEAASVAHEGLAMAEATGEHVLSAELHRVLGVALADPAQTRAGARLAARQGAALLLARFAT
jgi:DNA-binding SARP family transcriptional activator